MMLETLTASPRDIAWRTGEPRKVQTSGCALRPNGGGGVGVGGEAVAGGPGLGTRGAGLRAGNRGPSSTAPAGKAVREHLGRASCPPPTPKAIAR